MIRGEKIHFGVGFILGLVVCSTLGFFWLLWMFDVARAPEGDRMLVERCNRRGTTRDQFAETLAKASHYKAPDGDAWKGRIEAVKMGMTPEQVLATLGKPTFVEGSYDKAGTSFDGCYWHYVQSGEVSDSGYFLEDDFHTVRFDRNDRVDQAPLIEKLPVENTSAPSAPRR